MRVLEISEKAPKVEYQPDYSPDRILGTPKNDRPSVENTYSPVYIEAHRQQFENGALDFKNLSQILIIKKELLEVKMAQVFG